MIIHVIRALYLVLVMAFTVSYAFQKDVIDLGADYVTGYVIIPAAGALGLVLLDMFWRDKHLLVLGGLFFGLVAGLVIAYGLGQIVDLAGSVFLKEPAAVTSRQSPANGEQAGKTNGQDADPDTTTVQTASQQQSGSATSAVLPLVKVLVGLSAVFLCVSFVLQTRDDFRFIIPYVEFEKQSKGGHPTLLDTSVIIDGRIADITETRILDGELIVPRFVLAELQAIADSDDKLKRNRGRRGLDILNRLRESPKVDIRVMDMQVPAVDECPDVDNKLVALARHLNGRVMTNDYNLNKIAQLRGVDVININDLANALKPVVLPGEAMKVRVIRPGEEPGQGVGYLEDGTMVVAEQGRDYVGRDIVITVTSVLQTSAGRMIFGRLDADKTFGSRRGQSTDTNA
jgi:uncharacterized protein YacL